MRQIMQSLKNGALELAEAPCPQNRAGHLLIQTRATLISPGTERMIQEFGGASLMKKALQQPERVKAVFEKMRTDGLLPTLEAVRSKLDQPHPLGYCNVGTVLETDPASAAGVASFRAGQRVVSNGAHAEVVCVPRNLCCAVPAGVTDEEAAFAVLGAVALNGIRLADPTLGERFAVIGLGLIGLMAVQLLRAHGCQVLGVDFVKERLDLCRGFGGWTANLSQGEDPVAMARALSGGEGFDGVLIAASTKSSGPIGQAAALCRKKGRIVLVGVSGMRMSRNDFYEKELSFAVSCSYGPGRYDPEYEEKAHDYPFAHVRWTAQRNFEAVLQLMADNGLRVQPLITHRFKLDEAPRAYQVAAGKEHSLGIVLEYAREVPDAPRARTSLRLNPSRRPPLTNSPVVGVIGSGNYAGRVLIPAFQSNSVRLKSIACRGGISAAQIGKKFGFETVTTSPAELFEDEEINLLVIATRHDSHADLVCRGLDAGKHVFVEKPLCLSLEELSAIGQSVRTREDSAAQPLLMIGFNRRFAPHIRRIAELLSTLSEPKSFIMTVNAGQVPPDHWIHDPKIGGGRIIGEACHFVDLLRFLAGAEIVSATCARTPGNPSKTAAADQASIALSFGDGSIGAIHYLTGGHKSFPKERLEVFCQNRVLALDNFRKLAGFGWPRFRSMNLWRQDKGQKSCVQAFVGAVAAGRPSPIALEEILEVSRVTIEIAEAAAAPTDARSIVQSRNPTPDSAAETRSRSAPGAGEDFDRRRGSSE